MKRFIHRYRTAEPEPIEQEEAQVKPPASANTKPGSSKPLAPKIHAAQGDDDLMSKEQELS